MLNEVSNVETVQAAIQSVTRVFLPSQLDQPILDPSGRTGEKMERRILKYNFED